VELETVIGYCDYVACNGRFDCWVLQGLRAHNDRVVLGQSFALTVAQASLLLAGGQEDPTFEGTQRATAAEGLLRGDGLSGLVHGPLRNDSSAQEE
jgi:hypothetical protein